MSRIVSATGDQPRVVDAADTAAVPPPLVALDPAGAPSMINYQVPEPVSYSCNNIMVLNDYGLDDFADVVTNSVVTPGTITATAQLPAVVAPRSVVLSDSASAAGEVVAMSPFDQTARLSALTWANVNAATAAGKRIELFRSIGGLLDYRVRDLSRIVSSSSTAIGSLAIRPADTKQGAPVRTDPGDGTNVNPYVIVTIATPAAGGPVISGPTSGVVITVSGSFTAVRAGAVSLSVQLSDAAGPVGSSATASVTGSTWTAPVTVTASGQFTVTVSATSSAGVKATKAATMTVQLASPDQGGGAQTPAVAPSVTIEAPTDNSVFITGDGTLIVNVSGSVDTNGGSAVSAVSVNADGGTASTPAVTDLDGTKGAFTTTVEVVGNGPHVITATAVNADAVAAPAATIRIGLSASAPVMPVTRRLFLVETLQISAFLGEFGASRVVKTFSLLPGEQTTISIDSYTKSEDVAKSAQSIVDSTASECAADFEDTLNAEAEKKATNTDATNVSIQADVGAGAGLWHADIKGGYSDQTNASREQATKTVSNALAKHTSKASSNRSVNVNTDFSQTVSTGNTTDTTRTLKNINVSRVLNFVFRQMTQEHIVLTHLVDVSLGCYALDICLGADGTPQTGADGGPLTKETVSEYSLPEIVGFSRAQLTTTSAATLQTDLLGVLGTVADINGDMQALVELVTPVSSDGTPNPDAAYLRIKHPLVSTYTTPAGDSITVPGIVLDATSCVLRTDQLLVDAILGSGDALDSYSHALQDVAITERQVAVAREQLAQQIISTKDADMAAVWQKIYPPPLSVPATIDLTGQPATS